MAVLQSTSITGGLTMHGMAVGFMKLNAEGAVVIDNSTYAATSQLGSYLPLSGGTMTGKIWIPSSGSDTYGGAIEIRERGYASDTQNAWSFSPAISFHWGNRHAKRFGMRADGLFAVDDEPLALRSWVTSQGYVTGGPYLALSGGTVTGKTNIGTGGATAGGLLNITGASNNQVNISANSSWGLLIGFGDGNLSGGYHGTNHAAIINVQNAPLHLGTNNSSLFRLTSTGSTIDVPLTISTNEDGKLILRAPAGDTSQWNYINFVGTDGVRDSFIGTDGGGGPVWWRDDNNVNITLGSNVNIGGGGLVLSAPDADVRTNRGRFQVYNNAGTGNLGYRIRTDDNGGWRWQFVDGGNNEYFGVAYTSGVVTFGASSGTIASRGGFSDFIGYNASYGSYIGGGVANASNYLYAGGYFYDGSSVRTLWHTGNFNPGSYLPLSGGSMSGDIILPNNTSVALRNADGSAGFRPDDQWGNIYTWNTTGGYYVDATAYYFRSAGSTNWMTITGSGTVEAAADMRAPIFYDSNNTAFYLNPAGSSRLRNLYVGDSGSDWSDPGGWGSVLWLSHGPHSILRIENRNDARQAVMYSHQGQMPAAGSGGDYDFRLVRNYSDRITLGSSYITMHTNVHMSYASLDYVNQIYQETGGQPNYIYANNSGSYGSMRLTSTRNGWYGIYFDSGSTLMMNSNETGFYRQGYGWQWRWENGTAYVNKNSYGGGTSATVLDSSNYTSYAAPRAYVHSSFVEFTIYGDQNTYYPVTIHNWNGSHSWQRYSIHRGYGDTAPWNPIGTGSHQGGLTFCFDWAGDIAWGGNDKSIRVLEFDETYTTTVAGMQLAHCEGVVVWLRGGGSGGAYYRLHGPGGRSQSYSINMSSWTSCAGVTYSPRSYDGGTVNSEIRSRYPIRGSGSGDIYVNNQAVIHSGNIGSQSVNYATSAGNADTVDGYHATFSGNANTIPVRNANGYLEPNNWIQFNGAYGIYDPTNSAHLVRNNHSYGSWKVLGERNGWRGLHFGEGSGITLMMNEGEFGFHRESVGWVARFTSGTGHFNISGSADTVDGLHASAFARDYGQQVNVGSLNNLDGRFMVNLDGYGPINTAGGPDGSYNASLIGIGNSSRGHQIYLPYDQPNMYYRSGAGGWSAWRKVWSTGNHGHGSGLDADYVDGIEASRIVYGDNSTRTQYFSNSLDWLSSGFYNQSSASNMPSSSWYHMIVNRHINEGNNYQLQIAGEFWDSELWFRKVTGSSSAFTSWRRLIHSGGGTIDAGNLVIVNGYNLGINNSTPQYRLDVYQSSGIAASFGGSFSPGQFGGIHFGYLETPNTAYRKSALVFERTDNNNQGGNASGKIHFLLNNVASQSATALDSAVMTIDSDANGTNGSVRMGVGERNPSYPLHVSPTISSISIYAGGDIVAFSDRSVKADVKKIEDALHKVQKLNGYTFVRTDMSDKGRRAGVIAQEVEEVLPEVIAVNPDGTKAVAYGNLTSLLIEAIKEQQKQIEELKTKLDALT